jgi:AcrR family transcriptional regulator
MAETNIAPHILETAGRILKAEGPDGLTMDRLARETGLSRATLYRQCGGREAVLDALEESGRDVGDRTDTQARIFAGAREVFGRVGFEAASVEEVATAAKVGVATIYRTFGTKEGLVVAFLDQIAARRVAREARTSGSNDVRADLERLAERMLVAMQEDPALMKLLILETLRGGPLLPRVRAMSSARTVTSVASLLKEHMAAGRIADNDPKLLAQAFCGMVFSFGVVAPVLRSEPAEDPIRTSKAIVELFLVGARSGKLP